MKDINQLVVMFKDVTLEHGPQYSNSVNVSFFLLLLSLTDFKHFYLGGCGGITLPNGRTIVAYGNLLAIFQCDRGYHLEPSSLLFISCRGSRWTPSVPTCVRDY